MTVISLSTSTTNTIRDNRQASKAFTFRHSSHIYYIKSLLNLFQADRFGIFEYLRTATQKANALVARALAVEATPIWEPHPPPTLRKKSTPLATNDT